MSKIEWTEKTWNPLAGCKEISPGCANCYAATMAKRLEAMGQEKYQGTTKTLPNGKVVWTGKISLLDEEDDQFTAPLRRTKPTTYFVNSMSDLFHQDVPFEFVEKVFSVMHQTPHHTYQVLTKRPDRMAAFMNRPASEWTYSVMPISPSWPFSNVWLGTSVEDQQRADERIPYLLAVPAKVRFLSIEPMLGPINLMNHCFNCKEDKAHSVWTCCAGCDHPNHAADEIQWVIVGGESGHSARLMQIEWARSLRDQCQAVGVAFHFKQHGGWCAFNQIPDESLQQVELDRLPMLSIGENSYHRIGKKIAGRQLDGREWNELPGGMKS